MRDRQHRRGRWKRLERRRDQLSALVIEARGRFVEQKEWGVAKKGTGERDATDLASRELHATIAHRRLKALGQCHDEGFGAGGPSSVGNLASRRLWAAERNCLGDRSTRQVWSLWNPGHEPAPSRWVDVAKVCVADCDSSTVGMVEQE